MASNSMIRLSIHPISCSRSSSQLTSVIGGASQNCKHCGWVYCSKTKLRSWNLSSGSTRWSNGVKEPQQLSVLRLPQRAFSYKALKNTSREQVEGGDLEGFMRHVRLCNRDNDKKAVFLPFSVEEIIVGYIHPWFMKHLVDFPNVFTIHGEEAAHNNMKKPPTIQQRSITLHHDLISKEERTTAVGEALEALRQKGIIPGWRNEMYPVVSSFGGAPLFSMERSAVPFFGIKAYGVHMNGYVIQDGQKSLWIARRSKTKQTFPGLLDHLVAGGQPVGLTCKRNLIKECEEEAGIPENIAQRAIPVGAVSYEDINGQVLKRDVLFCYDLELPVDFQPYNKDGEVESFTLVPIAEVENIIWNTTSFKSNCVLVILDFLFRHGYIEPERKGYLQLFQSLRSGECL